MHESFVSQSELRQEIVGRILAEFERTIPVYKDMMQIARDINEHHSKAEELGKIMHGAVRVASPQELSGLRDILEIMGMKAHNFYDLRQNVSALSTAFRPETREELKEDGFRMFVSMLDIESVPEKHREFVENLRSRRSVFSDALLEIVETAKQQGGLTRKQADVFIDETAALFSRPKEAQLTWEEYETVRTFDKTVAQMLVSNRLPLNHLTPSVASVAEAQEAMFNHPDIEPIATYQGPVGRDILLRQTSCTAPPMRLEFTHADGSVQAHDYQETFIEFEERHAALTPEGRALYDELLDTARAAIGVPKEDPAYADAYYKAAQAAFAEFPADFESMWREGLAYAQYSRAADVEDVDLAGKTLEQAVELGLIELSPILYEDFLPKSAESIFMSNIGLVDREKELSPEDNVKAQFEKDLGTKVINMHDYYQALDDASRETVTTPLMAKPNGIKR